MNFCHRHNLVDPEKTASENRFGIKVSLPAEDTFRALLGENWEQVHWYPTELERDRAFDNMAERHGYYRNSDTPTQILRKVVK